MSVVADQGWIVGVCVTPGCGVEVRRPEASGRWAFLVNDLPLRCPACVEAAEEADRLADAERRRVERRSALRKALDESEVPSAYRVASLSLLWPPGAIYDAAAEWAQHGGGLMLTGPVGVGKTTLAGAAAMERLRRGGRLWWASTPLLFARLGSAFDSPARAWALRVLASTDALVLDDLDKARPTEYAAEQILLAVDQRMAHRAPLLVTTNMTPGEIADRWPEQIGDAIASRLVGYCRTLRLDGADRRLNPNTSRSNT